MNKADFVNAIAEKMDVKKKDASAFVEAYHEVVGEALANGEEIRFVGYGTYSVANRSGRTGRNPQTGETIEIPAKRAPKFKAGKALADRVN